MMKTVFIAILLIVSVVGHNHGGNSRGRCKKDFFLCGDEANRCFSRDLVCDGIFDCQNGKDEYKTARSSELNHILAEQRKKIEARQANAFGLQVHSSKQMKTFNNSCSSSDEESNDDDERTLQRSDSNSTTQGNFSSTNTLKDQIKNQHKKIVKQPAEVITTR